MFSIQDCTIFVKVIFLNKYIYKLVITKRFFSPSFMNPDSSKPISSIPSKLWKQFSSMKFAIILLVVLAIVSVLSLFIGEFYPVRATGPGWQEFWRQKLNMSKFLFQTLTFMEIHDPYRSWWYRLLLLLLSLSLFACILERIPVALKSMRAGTPKGFAETSKTPHAIVFTIKIKVENILHRLPGWFRLREERSGDEWRLSGHRGLFAHWGPILTHCGLLSLALGGFFTSWLGFNTRISGLPGDIVNNPAFDFAVRIDSFKIEYYPLGIGQYALLDNSFIGKIVARKGENFILEMRNQQGESFRKTVDPSRLRNQYDIQMDRGNIKDYISVLTIIENDREVFNHRVEVNHPLRYKGFRFYQTSFDTDHPSVISRIDSALIAIKSRDLFEATDSLWVQPDIPVALPNGDEMVLSRFLPDFRLDGSSAYSASAELHNPAALIVVNSDSPEHYYQWCFLKSAFQHANPEAHYSYLLLDVAGYAGDVTYATILEVKKNPGYGFIWLGFILATLGLVLTFYFTPQRIWIVVREEEGNRCLVALGGTTKRGQEMFKEQLEKWANNIKSANGI